MCLWSPDRPASSTRPDCSWFVLHFDIWWFRPDWRSGLHVRRRVESADHWRYAGRDGAARVRIWWSVGDAKSITSCMFCNRCDGWGDTRSTYQFLLCESTQELWATFPSRKCRWGTGSDGTTIPLVLENTIWVGIEMAWHPVMRLSTDVYSLSVGMLMRTFCNSSAIVRKSMCKQCYLDMRLQIWWMSLY